MFWRMLEKMRIEDFIKHPVLYIPRLDFERHTVNRMPERHYLYVTKDQLRIVNIDFQRQAAMCV